MTLTAADGTPTRKALRVISIVLQVKLFEKPRPWNQRTQLSGVVIYIAKYEEVVYVLHAFNKKT